MISNITKRILTAIVIAPIFVWSIFAIPKDYFSFFLLTFVVIGGWELSRLIKIENLLLRALYVFFIVILALYIKINWHVSWVFSLVICLSTAWWLVNLYWIVSYPQKTKLWFGSASVRIVNGAMLLIPMWLSLSHIHIEYGPSLFLLLMLIVWAADSGAYFVGKATGKRKLSPLVSPNKTVEGFVGGIIFSLLTLISFMVLFNETHQSMHDNYLGYIALVVVIASVSVLGDLYESLFKRVSGIKDSGQILPGHGGILDRIDSLTAAAPFFVLGLELL